MSKTYILLKDLPDALAGTEYQKSFSGQLRQEPTYYEPVVNESNRDGIKMGIVRKRLIHSYWVENSPEWFKLKEDHSCFDLLTKTNFTISILCGDEIEQYVLSENQKINFITLDNVNSSKPSIKIVIHLKS